MGLLGLWPLGLELGPVGPGPLGRLPLPLPGAPEWLGIPVLCVLLALLASQEMQPPQVVSWPALLPVLLPAL